MKATKEQSRAEMIERIGIFYEQNGYPPVAGRMFGHLLLSDPPQQTFYDLQEALKASKSAISNSLKFLMNEGVVDYITFTGDRKRYFKINSDKWLAGIKIKIQQATAVRGFLEQAIEERSKDYPEYNEELVRILDLYKMLEIKLPKLIEDWENE